MTWAHAAAAMAGIDPPRAVLLAEKALQAARNCRGHGEDAAVAHVAVAVADLVRPV